MVTTALVRSTETHTTGTLAAGAQELSTVTIAKSFDVLEVAVDIPARVRLYRTAAQRDADAARPTGTLPTDTAAEHGCFLDAIFPVAGAYTVTFGGRVFLNSGNMVPIAVQNRSGSSGMVIATFLVLPFEVT